MEVPTNSEGAARQILQVAVRDFAAGEVHFEPLPGGTHRVRVRGADGRLHALPAEDVAEAKTFLVQTAADVLTLTVGDAAVYAAVAVLPTPDGDRVRVAFLSHEAVSLGGLPMRGAVRESLEAALRGGKIAGGALFIAGGNRDRFLKNRTVDAIRAFVSDADTIVLDDTHAKRSDRLNAQRPDVLVCYDFAPRQNESSHIYLSQQHGTLVVTATKSRFFAKPLYPAILGVLTVLPLAPDDANATDRYEWQGGGSLAGVQEKPPDSRPDLFFPEP